LERLLPVTEYALDTEFRSGETYRPVLALVQIYLGGEILLIDPLSTDLSPLRELLLSPGIMVAHAAYADLELLELALGVVPTTLFDTQVAASLLGMSSPSLAYLSDTLLGISIDKSLQRTDWTRRPLSEPARTYAAGDVAYLQSIHSILRAQLTQQNKLSWCEEECSRALNVALTKRPEDDAWQRVKGAPSLRPGPRRVAQAVARWREEQAKQQDLLPKRVLSDEAVIKLAKIAPNSLSALRSIGGMSTLPEPTLRLLLNAIRGAAQASAPALIDRRVALELEPAINVLLAVATHFAYEIRVDPSLVASRSDIEALVSGRPSRLDTGWRATEVAPLLRDVLSGTASVTMSEAGQRFVIEYN
jgi:ribonuclease D